jgi:hypothetical protein
VPAIFCTEPNNLARRCAGSFPFFANWVTLRPTQTNKGNMELFTTDNTTGYTVAELAAINAEWLKHCEQHDISEDSPNYHQEAKWFADRVARR